MSTRGEIREHYEALLREAHQQTAQVHQVTQELREELHRALRHVEYWKGLYYAKHDNLVVAARRAVQATSSEALSGGSPSR